MRYDLLVFDWDGTLMDSEARIVACMECAISDLGLEPRGADAIRDIIGLGLRESVETLYPGADDRLFSELVGAYRRHFLVENSTPSELFPATRQTIAALRDGGYLLAIATGKGRQGLDKVLRATGLGPLFHATRCADETFSKPHPEMLLQLIDELGVEPGRTLMIGDTEYDMEMARNAGTDALAVSYGVHSAERLQLHNPRDCIAVLDDLGGWLERAADGVRERG